ncbi:glycosyltransferase [Gilvimarinus sp. SDUM040013]|uniref:Glycosyltransferase n=1 Tax=Gilvimarinus gilvus TaxID=3058038 RepID=A0ABU4RXX9_9GAMM|nr:glycosyltransferase [Gilvimarinus sp. SDUM040013]MDO3387322.1 glycosyltransferase [Gilvimarinus sp. SDUM040013]MDX6849011.1 glycosyltransferase [Gilvimarinus sp. SDUM040013]
MTSDSSKTITALHVGKFYPPHRGGMETYLRDLLTALQHQGVRCIALVHDSPESSADEKQTDPGETTGNSPTVVRAAVWANLLFTPISPGFAWQLNRLLREESPSVLHLHMPNVSAFWALFLPRARRIPWVVHWHADVPVGALHRGIRWFYRIYRPFERWVLRRAAVIVTTSPPYMRSSAPLKPFLERSRVVPLGIREPAPVSSDQTAATEQNSPLQLIAVGRLTYYKGFEVLLRALTQCPQVTLGLIGDGECRHELSALIDDLQLSDRVALLGNLSEGELDQRLRASDCLCLPSIERTEAFGVVLLEAMARGKACVVTDVPGTGMPWVVQNDLNGLVVPPNDSGALAEALNRLAANRPLCKSMGEIGLKRFTEQFCIDASADTIAKIYSELTGMEAK